MRDSCRWWPSRARPTVNCIQWVSTAGVNRCSFILIQDVLPGGAKGTRTPDPLLAKIVRPACRPAPLLVGATNVSPRVTVIDRRSPCHRARNGHDLLIRRSGQLVQNLSVTSRRLGRYSRVVHARRAPSNGLATVLATVAGGTIMILDRLLFRRGESRVAAQPLGVRECRRLRSRGVGCCRCCHRCFRMSRTLQGMARVRLGQASAWPLVTDREAAQRLRRSRVAKGHFRRKRKAPLTVEGCRRTLSGPSPDPSSAVSHTS
jgi:hypothetical protein